MTIGANLKLRLRRRIFVITLGLLIAEVGMLGHALEHTIDLAQDRPHATLSFMPCRRSARAGSTVWLRASNITSKP